MKNFSFFVFAVLLLASCSQEVKFTVTGSISNADGKKLYLEASEIQGVVLLDSVKLKSNGNYSFKQPRPFSPEFYRLRIDNRIINFSIDSTETVTIDASFANFPTDYTVQGSESSEKIKELVLKQIALQKNLNDLLKSNGRSRVNNEILEDSIARLLDKYKEDVTMNYIFAAPNSAAAYFALFQQVNSYLIFDPMNSKNDLKAFQAVATSLDVYYPHAVRSKNLRNLALKSIKNQRKPRENVVEIPEDKITETGIIDINLPDIKGKNRKLSDLKGKVVLLDFTVYQNALSTPHNFTLNDFYEKYADKGLEIYQVSFDANEHFWKTVADNLPWTCVRDPNGIYSTLITTYNLQQLPALFLVNRNNELSMRAEKMEDVDAAIKALL